MALKLGPGCLRVHSGVVLGAWDASRNRYPPFRRKRVAVTCVSDSPLNLKISHHIPLYPSRPGSRFPQEMQKRAKLRLDLLLGH